MERSVFTIWDSESPAKHYDEWEKGIREEYPDMPDEEILSYAYEMNGEYLYCEQENLHKIFPDDATAVIIGTLQRWNGGFPAYKLCDGNRNILCCHDDSTAFSVRYDEHLKKYVMKADMANHDASYSMYVFLLPENVSRDRTESVLSDYVYKDLPLETVIQRLRLKNPARSIAKVYGWKLKRVT